MIDEEDLTAQLLRLAGAPPDPPADRAERVRQTVHREWRADRRRRTFAARGRLIATLAVAASLDDRVCGRRLLAPRQRVHPSGAIAGG